LANGMPLSVLVGREQWMRHVLTINYSLTFRLEAMSIVAAIETIREVNERDVCADLARKGRMLKAAYAELCKTYEIASAMVGHDSRPQLEFFDEEGLHKGTCNYLVIKELAQNRICTYGTFSLCYAHTDKDIRTVVRALDRGLQKVAVALRESPATA
jgi:glutamate-1-semialdehyde 2,1-aminomutase